MTPSRLLTWATAGTASRTGMTSINCPVGDDLACNRAERPYPHYSSLLRADFNGNSSYNALVAKYQHRVTGGLNIRAEYTFAKALTDGWESGGSSNQQIATKRFLDKDLASFDTRHRTVFQPRFGISPWEPGANSVRACTARRTCSSAAGHSPPSQRSKPERRSS